VECFEVTGGTALSGRVRVTGAKNSALKLMAAALLAAGRTTIDEVPDILDVTIMSEVLRRLGCGVTYERTEGGGGGGRVVIDVPEAPSTETDYDLVRRMRASINVLGPLVARCGSARVALPGGDAIGSRGLDMHISGLERLGATIVSEHGFLVATAPRLTGTSIWLDFPSVGATENLMMAAVLAAGTTVIDNAAREPEIVDLCTMLTTMGARIEGAGTSTITVEGVDALSPVSYTTVPDRIVAGTWAIGAVMTRGDVVIERAIPEHLTVALDKLTTAGATVEAVPGGLRVAMADRPRCVDVVTPAVTDARRRVQRRFPHLCGGGAHGITDGRRCSDRLEFESAGRSHPPPLQHTCAGHHRHRTLPQDVPYDRGGVARVHDCSAREVVAFRIQGTGIARHLGLDDNVALTVRSGFVRTDAAG